MSRRVVLFTASALVVMSVGCSPGELGGGNGIHERYAAGLRGKLGLLPPKKQETGLLREATSTDTDPALPSKFNWQDEGVVTTAKDQGGCGSCWAFAAVGVIESKILMLNGSDALSAELDLSEQQLVSCDDKSYGCNGGPLSALNFYNDKGPMQEACTSYSATDGDCSELGDCVELPYRTKGYYEARDVESMKRSVYKDGPASFGYPVYTDFFTFWSTGAPGEVYRNDHDVLEGYHAVVLVGWDDEKQALLLKNSWGATGGPNGDGTFWLSYADHKNELYIWMANTDLYEPQPQPKPKFSAVGAGNGFTCTIKADKSLACWGLTKSYGSDQMAIPPAGSFKSLAVGANHSCAIKDDNTVVCWGDGRAGETSPPEGEFLSLSLNRFSSCGIRSDGTVTCWGEKSKYSGEPPEGKFLSLSVDDFGLSCGLRSDQTLACWAYRDLPPTPAGKFVSVSTGNGYGCAIKEDNSLLCWGESSSGQTSPPEGKYLAVSAARSYACGIKDDKTLACWGRDKYGRTKAPSGTYSSLTTGRYHACAFKESGEMVCWGENGYGQSTPIGRKYRSVSSRNGTCAIRTDNSVDCWGGTHSPPPGKYLSVELNYWYGCGIKTDNTLVCWQLEGDNVPTSGGQTPPEGQFKAIGLGSSFGCGLRLDDTITCWGDSNYGLTAAPEGKFLSLAVSSASSCAVREDHKVLCWGWDFKGETRPPQDDFLSVSASTHYTCGIKTDNTVACWGEADGLQLPGEYQSIVAFSQKACGIKTDKSLACWTKRSTDSYPLPKESFRQLSSPSPSCGVTTDDRLVCWGKSVR